MSFVILRTAKLKTAGEIGGSLGHNYRMMDTPNADDSLTHLNEHECTLEQVKQNIENRLPETIRKNGVRVVEYLITASPDWQGWGTDAETEFFNQAKKWLKEKHGSENVTGLSIHRDESTPHLVAYVVPIDPQGKLNARHFLGGKQKLSEMQTDFANQVHHLGLERGLEGSRAKHKKIKQFYSEINQPLEPFKEVEISRLETQPESGFFDSKKEHGERVIDAVYDHISVQFDEYEKQKRAEFSALTAKLLNEQSKNKKLEKQVTELVEVSKTLKNVISEYDQEFEPFHKLKSKSEYKYQELKQTAENEHEKILQKEIDSMRMTITPQSDFDKKFDKALKEGFAPKGPQLDQVQQPEKKKDKGNDFDLGM